MRAFGKYLPLLVLTITLLTISACEDKSPTGSREATVFTWEYVMDDPTYFHSIQQVPPLAVEEDGTVWIAGYLGTAGNSHRCIARRRPGGQWEAWADNSTPGNYYAYDVGVEPGSGMVYITIVGNPTVEQSGLYQFTDNPPYFQLIYAHPDPGPVAFNEGTGVMFTRHMNNANSGYYSFADSAFHNYTFPEITGDVFCAAIRPNEYLALAITNDNYLVRLLNNQLDSHQFQFTNYDMSFDTDFTMCTDQGVYTGYSGDQWQPDYTFPGDKAYSSSLGSYKMVLGEKNGVIKVYKRIGGTATYIEETLNYPVGIGRLKMVQSSSEDFHEGFIYDGEALLERVAH